MKKGDVCLFKDSFGPEGTTFYTVVIKSIGDKYVRMEGLNLRRAGFDKLFVKVLEGDELAKYRLVCSEYNIKLTKDLTKYEKELLSV